MYTVLIKNDNTVVTTNRIRIMQNSKLVDNLRIIVLKTYNELVMSECNAYLEYVTPITHKHNFVELQIADDNYKENYLLYKISIDTDITSEPGDVEFYVHFVKVDMDEDGTVSTPVRQTEYFIVPIIPIANWFSAPDPTLSALDQRIIALQELIKANVDMQNIIADGKIDSLKLDADLKQIYGTSKGKKVGEAISIEDLGDEIANNTNAGMIYVNEYDEEV